ncbi:MAG: hypothetical protein ABSB97_07775 [Thermoplasmata archaeon]
MACPQVFGDALATSPLVPETPELRVSAEGPLEVGVFVAPWVNPTAVEINTRAIAAMATKAVVRFLYIFLPMDS